MNIIPPTHVRPLASNLNKVNRPDKPGHSPGVDVKKDRRQLPDRRHGPTQSRYPMDLRQSGDRRKSKRIDIAT